MPLVKAADEIIQAAKQADKGKAALKAAKSQTKVAKTSADNKLAKLMSEYDDVLGKADAAEEEILGQFKESNQKAFQDLREQRLFDPKSDRPGFDYQTANREEYSKRYQQQFQDPEFASRAITPDEIPNLADEISGRFLMDQVFQSKAGRAIKSDPRTLARAETWVGDSPYKLQNGQPRVFIHIDRISDPLRANSGDFIQFDQPKEMGLHSGTNLAAQRATILDPDAAEFKISSFSDEIAELEAMAEWAPGELENTLTSALESYWLNVFKGSRSEAKVDLDDMYDQVFSALADAGLPDTEARSLIENAKALPLANSTPHLFRGKNGLYLRDSGGFGAEAVNRQLQQIFNNSEDLAALDMAMGLGSNVEKQKALQQFIEKKGFDHIVYHNSVEDRGSTSVINWNPDLMVSILDETIQGQSPRNLSKAATSFILGAMGFGTAAQQESN